MTIALDDRPGDRRPVYLRIADAIAREVSSGALAPGARLPTQRQLAGSLGLTLTTVTRAYREAARRGLITGTVGRGTFVRGGADDDRAESAVINLSVNTVVPHIGAAELMPRVLLEDIDRLTVLDYGPAEGDPGLRAAMMRHLATRGVEVSPDALVITAGAQHALFVACLTLVGAGGTLLTDAWTYSGVRAIAADLPLSLHGLDMDDEGLRPEALDEACRQGIARVLYVMPSMHNPTGGSMSEARRRAIADIVRRRQITIIEDDAYGFLAPERAPLATMVPGECVLVATLAKSVAAGLRIGCIAAPPALVGPLLNAVGTTTVGVSPITARIAASAIDDGTAARVATLRRQEMSERQRLARELLPVPAATLPASPHVWLPLERPWKAEAFAAEARARGVLVVPGGAFAARTGAVPRAVRVSLGAPRTREALVRGLTVLRDLLREPPPRPRVL